MDIEAEVVDAADPALHKYLCNPKIPKSKGKIKPLLDLIRTLRLEAYFNDRFPFDKLLRVLQTVDVRNAVEGLCLTTMSAEEIVTLVNRRWGHALTKEELLQYQTLFFDTSEMDIESWLFHVSKCDTRGSLIKRFALTNPDEHEKVKWLCDIPVNLEYTEMLRKGMSDAFFHFNKAMSSNFPDVAAAKALASVMTQLGDRLKKWGGARNENAVDAAIRILEQNRSTGNVPRAAKIVGGPLDNSPPQLMILPPVKKAPGS